MHACVPTSLLGKRRRKEGRKDLEPGFLIHNLQTGILGTPSHCPRIHSSLSESSPPRELRISISWSGPSSPPEKRNMPPLSVVQCRILQKRPLGQCLNPPQEEALPSFEVLDHCGGEVSMQRQLIMMARMQWGYMKFAWVTAVSLSHEDKQQGHRRLGRVKQIPTNTGIR